MLFRSASRAKFCRGPKQTFSTGCYLQPVLKTLSYRLYRTTGTKGVFSAVNCGDRRFDPQIRLSPRAPPSCSSPANSSPPRPPRGRRCQVAAVRLHHAAPFASRAPTPSTPPRPRPPRRRTARLGLDIHDDATPPRPPHLGVASTSAAPRRRRHLGLDIRADAAPPRPGLLSHHRRRPKQGESFAFFLSCYFSSLVALAIKIRLQ